MGKHTNPKPSNPYSETNIREFLSREFANNQVMRMRLTNLFDGVREQAYRAGVSAAEREMIKEIDLFPLRSRVITEYVIMTAKTKTE